MELEVVRPSNPMALIQSAIEKGHTIDNLGKLLDMQERFEKMQAAKEFAHAVTQFQAKMPQIHKGRKAVGKMTFNYAALDDIMRIASPILAENGIVISFTTELTELTMPAAPSRQGDPPNPPKNVTAIKATCRVRVGTHFEETTVPVPVPAGYVTDSQLFGMAVTYARRYALCAALNIVVTDEDTDGQGIQETLDKSQIETIDSLIGKCRDAQNPVNYPKFLAWLDVPDGGKIADIRVTHYQKAVDELNRKLKEKR